MPTKRKPSPVLHVIMLEEHDGSIVPHDSCQSRRNAATVLRTVRASQYYMGRSWFVQRYVPTPPRRGRGKR